MRSPRIPLIASFVLLGLALPALADGPSRSPVPLTRDDVKRALEDSKHATPRLPLPPPTEEEKARAAEAAKAAQGQPNGRGFGLVNNGRMRALYLSDYNTS